MRDQRRHVGRLGINTTSHGLTEHQNHGLGETTDREALACGQDDDVLGRNVARCGVWPHSTHMAIGYPGGLHTSTAGFEHAVLHSTIKAGFLQQISNVARHLGVNALLCRFVPLCWYT
jgi:hypothetical protein